MTIKELKKLTIGKQAIDGHITQKRGARLLGVSYRQMKRIVSRIRREGEVGVKHRGGGRPSNRRIGEETKEAVLRIYQHRYSGFAPTLAQEKLEELEGMRISVQTMRNWLIEADHWQVRKRGRKHRRWRQRKDYFGEMVQLDGSHHRWLEERGGELVLMGYIDDATGNVFGRFYEYEGTLPAMDSFRRYISKYGVPLSVYLDKHSTYKSLRKARIGEQLAGLRDGLSQFERAMQELGVEVIHAHSAPAKGRIERLFKTFQDRLVKEMRLAVISNLQEANQFLEKYLPVYNQKFHRAAAKPADLHRQAPGDKELSAILCIRKQRVLRNDFTFMYAGKFYQVKQKTTGRKVEIRQNRFGSFQVLYNGRKLSYKEIQPVPPERPSKMDRRLWQKKATPQKMDHPWKRRTFLAHQKRTQLQQLKQLGE